jgi:Ca2+-binding RTX toxin-like protein
LFEPLEAREFLSAPPSTYTAIHRVKTLSLHGTKGDDVATVDVKKGRIVFTLNGVTRKYSSSGVGTISINLGDGNDLFVAGAAAPALSVSGGAGDDTIIGGSRNDTLVGDGDDDSIIGNAGNDVIDAGEGQDTLLGNAGRDTLWSQDGETDVVDGGADYNTGFIDVMDGFIDVQDRHYFPPDKS